MKRGFYLSVNIVLECVCVCVCVCACHSAVLGDGVCVSVLGDGVWGTVVGEVSHMDYIVPRA